MFFCEARLSSANCFCKIKHMRRDAAAVVLSQRPSENTASAAAKPLPVPPAGSTLLGPTTEFSVSGWAPYRSPTP